MRGTVWDGLRSASPAWLRSWIKGQRWFIPISTRLFGNSVYSRGYYLDLERIESASVVAMAEWITGTLLADRPGARVLDVGCGSGLLLAALEARGATVEGVDLSPEAIAMAREKGLTVRRLDLTDPDQALPEGPFDLVVSCEVAEHLEPRFADRFVDRLVAAAPLVFLTAAEPDPAMGPGLYHFNEQPNDYWIERFAARGVDLDEAATADARATLEAAGVVRYLARPMILRRSGDGPAADPA